jgi:tRNA threonylcarbamoyladenosine biosynthesis protein TsaB
VKILGIDTSTRFFCLGLYCDGKVYEYILETGRKLSSLIAVTVKRALDALGWQPADINYFACGLGPGSFTGMRTGISFIKGMSWALKRPLIGISSLDILAQGVRSSSKPILTIVDAKRGLIYYSVFKKSGNGLKKIKPYLLLSYLEFLKSAKSDCVILGDALDLYKEDIVRSVKGAEILEKDYWYPAPHSIIELALARIREKELDDPFCVKPVYLYPKECQIRK